MIDFLKKMRWQQRVVATEKYQKEYTLSVRQLADEFECSKSRVAMDLTLAAALRVYPQLDKVEKYNEAVAFIKKKGFKK